MKSNENSICSHYFLEIMSYFWKWLFIISVSFDANYGWILMMVKMTPKKINSLQMLFSK